MEQTNSKSKRRLTVVDVFAVLIVLACIVTLVIGLYVKKNSPGEITDRGEYRVSFTVKSIRASTAKLLTNGSEFFLSDGTVFGTLADNVSVTPAVIYSLNEDGVYIKTFAEDNGDNTLVDVAGVMNVNGGRDSSGLFRTSDKTYVAPAAEITLHSDLLEMTVTVTGIEKVK